MARNLHEIQQHFTNSDFDLLLNESRLINVNELEINVVGVENWGDGRYGDLEKACYL